MKHIALPLFLSLSIAASAQPQLALDTVSGQNNIVFKGTVTSDGDRVMAIRSTEGILIWRAHPDGTPVWSRRIGTTPLQTASMQCVTDSSGGLVLVYHLSDELISNYPDEGLVDTLRMHYLLTRLDANGAIDWQRAISFQFDHSMGVMYQVIEAVAGAGPNALYMVVRTVDLSPNGSDKLSCLKMDMQGQLVWSRSFQTSYDNQAWNVVKVAGDDAGGMFIWGMPDHGSAQIRLAHVAQDGALDWIKQYQYANFSVSPTAGMDAVALPDGTLLNLCQIQVPGHYYLSTFRVDGQGMVVDADFYAHPAIRYSQSHWIGHRADGSNILAIDSLVMQVNDTGSVTAAAVFDSHVTGDQRNTFIPMNMNIRPEGAVFPGILKKVHVDLGITQYWPAVRTIDPIFPGCHATAAEVAHVSVPVDLYQVQDVGSYQEVNLQMEMHDSAGTSLPHVDIATMDLCALMLPTAIKPVVGHEWYDLLNTAAQTGQPFRFTTAEARLVSVLDASGRFLQQGRLYQGGQAVETMGWAPGIYLLRIAEKDGSAVRCCRVLVTP